MADINRAVQVASSLEFGDWEQFPVQADKGPYINGFLTAIKSDTLEDIKAVYLAIGVETGIEDTIGIQQIVKLDFEIDKGSDINKKIAFLPINTLPNGFYYKLNSVLEYSTESKAINGLVTVTDSEDTYNIEVNLVVL